MNAEQHTEEYSDSSSDEDDSWCSDAYIDNSKKQVLSKKQKQMILFKTIMQSSYDNFQNAQYLDFEQNLKELNHAIIANKWNAPSHKMPKFYVHYMAIIINKLKDLNIENKKQENFKKEKRVIKSLKKNIQKLFKHYKQIQLYQTSPKYWENENIDDWDASDDDTKTSDDDSDNNDDPSSIYANINNNNNNIKDDNGDDSGWDSCWDDDDDEDVDNGGDNYDDDDGNDDDDCEQIGLRIYGRKLLAKMRKREYWVQKKNKGKKNDNNNDFNNMKFVLDEETTVFRQSDFINDDPQFSNKIHLRLQQRNGRKSITIIQGLDDDLNLKLMLKCFRKILNRNGSIDNKNEGVLKLQGDVRKEVSKLLIEFAMCEKSQIVHHGF